MSNSSDSEEEEVPLLIEYTDKLSGIQNGACKRFGSVPVTILSGFLGAGKSTLVRYILTNPDHGKRIAVIENEFAGLSSDNDERQSLSVETLIVQDVDSDSKAKISDLIELPNGCICCTVKDNLVEALENLLERRGNGIDYILIEASGMANPGPIASVFWLDDALESRLKLDGIVTMVDAKNIIQQLDETRLDDKGKGGGEAEQQIAFADRIIINKKDLVNEEQLNEVISTIEIINPTSPFQITTYSNVPNLDWILSTNSFDVDRFLTCANRQQWNEASEKVDFLTKSRCSDLSCKSCQELLVNNNILCGSCDDSIHKVRTGLNISSRSKGAINHSHTGSIRTVVLIRNGSVSLKKINAWLSSILWPNQDGQSDSDRGYATIFRIKGILSIIHKSAPDFDLDTDPKFIEDDGYDSRRYIVQAVNDLWEIHPANINLAWAENENRCCKLVLIGRKLDYKQLENGFLDCFE